VSRKPAFAGRKRKWRCIFTSQNEEKTDGIYMDQRFLPGDRSGETAADLKRTYRRGGSLGRRIPGSALDGPIRKTEAPEG
jgi:hypothetical protein